MSTLIIDASNMAYRARYSYSLSHNGKDTSVTYGVLRMTMALIKEFRPDSVIMCFDGGRPSYRTRLVPGYKSNRKHDEDPTFIEYMRQMHELQRMLPYFGMLCVKREGIEADDLMYHASRLVRGHSYVVTNDDDLLQAVNDNVHVVKPGKKDYTLVTTSNFKEVTGVDSRDFLMAKTLMGDSSDCIPGVRGIGQVTVSKMFAGSHELDLSVLNAKLREDVKMFLESGDFALSYDCASLAHDLSGARYTIVRAMWIPFNSKMVYKYCMDNAFVSLIEAGSLGQVFGSLRQPVFDKAGWRFPRIWDTARYPV